MTTEHDGETKSDVLADWIPEADVAAMRGVSLRTLQRERQMRTAPPWVKWGNQTYYLRSGIGQHLRARLVRPVDGEAA